MSGLFNSGIRDFCGDESAVSQLAKHFSTDFSNKQDNNSQNVMPGFHQSVPTSFNLNDLFKNVLMNEKSISENQYQVMFMENIEEGRGSDVTQQSNSTGRQYNFCPSSFITPTYFNVPQPMFSAPDQSLVARVWAQSELEQYNNSLITEDDLKVLTESDVHREPELRFSDIIRNMTLEDEQNEIDISTDESKQTNNDFLYDLDRDLKNMREKLMINEDLNDMWPHMTQDFDSTSKEFNFIKDNHYADSLKNSQENQAENIDQLLNKGIQLYREGYFSEAMLAFEAVVQARPESEYGWQYLALSLSENEQDNRALVACKKCLDINKDNREILLSLARIYCNEMNISSTITCLERWLLSNPKYRDLATVGQEALHNQREKEDSIWQDMFEESFESSGQFAIIQEQLNAAQIRNGPDVDSELEIALGTLYHAIQDYDKSTLYFENAAKGSQDSPLLWNKLGTAYCNSGSFDKAINMYQRALDLAPGFVRAECNLGVSFYNMGNYSDAIKHALKAYKLQHPVTTDGVQGSLSTGEERDSVMETDPIWTLIRMSCFKMDRPDLDLVVFSRDVDTLCTEFGA